MERTVTTRNTNGFLQALLVVAIIGAINWGLIGFFNWNLVDAIFGGGVVEETSAASRVVYALVGLCGVAAALALPRVRTVDSGRPASTAAAR